MSATATVLYQKHGVNHKTTGVQIAFIGNYPGDPGEVVSLLAADLLNPKALNLTGPNDFPDTPPRVSSTQSGGWQMQLKPTATAGQYDVSLWNGTTELTATGYAAAVTGGVFIVELDFAEQNSAAGI
jgi:hypothetical protein